MSSSLWPLRTLATQGDTPPNTTHPSRKLESSYLGKQNTFKEKSSKYWHSVFTDTKWYWQLETTCACRIFLHHIWQALPLPEKKATNLLQVVLAVKNPSANAGDIRAVGSITWLRRFPWSRKWQPTPVFLPGETHGQRSLVGYGP